jgi:hypothetical protein
LNSDSSARERKNALAPILDRLALLRDEGQGEGLDALGFPPDFTLDPWEERALNQALGEEGNSERDWRSLLAEGIAFQALYFSHSDRSEEAESADDEETGREQRIRTAAIGLALMEELQRVIDEALLAGKMDEARRLTGFRNRLAQIAARIRVEVGTEGFQRAESLSVQMVTPFDLLKTPKKDEPKEDEHKPRKAVRFEGRTNYRLGRPVKVERRSHLKTLLVVLAASILAWSILILPRSWRPTLPVLTHQDLAFSPAIREITARPPSLFLVVDGPEWSRMPAARREELVRQVAESAEAAGYTGAHFRTGGGLGVALWTRLNGVGLIEPTDEPS